MFMIDLANSLRDRLPNVVNSDLTTDRINWRRGKLTILCDTFSHAFPQIMLMTNDMAVDK